MKRLRLLVILMLAVLFLSSCSSRRLTVVTTSYPVEFLVEKIAGDRVDVKRLDQGGPVVMRSQIVSDYKEVLLSADVVFIINELQPYYEIYRDDIYNRNVIDLAALSTLYQFQRYTSVTVNSITHVLEGPYYDTPLLDNVDMYRQLDPFLWMDPMAMVSMGDTIRDWLVKNYPAEEAFFNSNFDKLEVDLTQLQARFQALRNTKNRIKLATITPSFGNWQKSYYIEINPVVLSKFGVTPNEELLSVIRQRLIDDNVKYIVYEANLPEDYQVLYNRLKTELSLTEVPLNNLYSLSDQDKASNVDYITLMVQNLETLEALTE